MESNLNEKILEIAHSPLHDENPTKDTPQGNSNTVYEDDNDDLDLDNKRQASTLEQKPTDSLTKFIGISWDDLRLGMVYTLSDSGSYDVLDLDIRGAAFPIVAVYWAIYLSVFVYLLISTAYDTVNTPYLSPQSKSADGAICESVAITLTATFEGDATGMWDSSRKFNYSESIYQVQFTGTQMNNHDFSASMQAIQTNLANIGFRSTVHDYAWSLIALSAWSVYDDNYNLQFTSNGLGNIIFNVPVASVSFGSLKGVCNMTDLNYYVATNFDSFTGILTLQITLPWTELGNDYYSWVEGNLCPDQITSNNFKYILDTTNFFDIKIDMNAISSAIAINFDINPLSNLVQSISAYVQFDDDTIWASFLNEYGNFYTDPLYEGELPIFCLNEKHDKERKGICFVYSSATFFFPVIASANLAPDKKNSGKTGKTCQSSCTEPISEQNSQCQKFDALLGLIFWPIQSMNDTNSTISLFKLGMKLKAMNDTQMIEFLYPALEATVMGSPQYHNYYNESKQFDYETLYDNLCDGSCSMLTVEFYSGDSTDTPFYNAYGVQLATLSDVYARLDTPKGPSNVTMMSCQNLIYKSHAMSHLGANPPVNLVESYYTCHTSFSTALQRSLGIAAASSAFYCAVALIIMMYGTIYYYNSFTDTKFKKILSQDEKQEIQQKNLETKLSDLQQELEDCKEKLNLVLFKVLGQK